MRRRSTGIHRAIRFGVRVTVVAVSMTPVGIVLWIRDVAPPVTDEDRYRYATAFVVALAVSAAIAVGLLSTDEN